MYTTGPAAGVLKTILALGTLIVMVQAKEWLSREDTAFKEGEFYMLIISTLLGMNMMVSANHFLLFFLGLEMASVPMACLVAFDKYRHNSAEAGAKFVLTATFSSGVMIYGISLLYAACGTLYFNDMANVISASPLTIAGMVFFFSGLGFKISLVPFHFWTADSYQGAPTTVTGYLSVVSKGAAAFTLCAILMKVFAANGRVLDRIALHRDCTFYHYRQPVCHPSERPEAFHGILFYLSGRLHHVGSGRQLSDERYSPDLLCIDLCSSQPERLRHHLLLSRSTTTVLFRWTATMVCTRPIHVWHS